MREPGLSAGSADGPGPPAQPIDPGGAARLTTKPVAYLRRAGLDAMWVVAGVVGVISLIAVGGMIQSALAAGFTFLVAPIVVLELLFLGTVFVLWRAAAGRKDAFESQRGPAPSRRARLAPRSLERPGGQELQPREDGLRSRIARLANWWFNGLHDPSRR